MEAQLDIYKDAVVFITGKFSFFNDFYLPNAPPFDRRHWLRGQSSAGEAAVEFSPDQAHLHAHPRQGWRLARAAFPELPTE